MFRKMSPIDDDIKIVNIDSRHSFDKMKRCLCWKGEIKMKDYQSWFESVVEDVHEYLAAEYEMLDNALVVLPLRNVKSFVTWHVLCEIKRYSNFKLKVVRYVSNHIDDGIEDWMSLKLSPFKTHDVTKEFALASNGSKSRQIFDNYIDFKTSLLTEDNNVPLDPTFLIDYELTEEDAVEILKWLQSR